TSMMNTGTQLVCDKCPAGTYVSIHCSPTSVRECSPCPKGTFTRGENGVQQCHRCRSPCPAGFIEKTPCTATQDRICTCPPNTFLSGDGAAVCKPHSLCPPGKRVKKQGSEKKDVVCKQCSEGTFSDVKSSATQCRNHTDCQVQGLNSQVTEFNSLFLCVTVVSHLLLLYYLLSLLSLSFLSLFLLVLCLHQPLCLSTQNPRVEKASEQKSPSEAIPALSPHQIGLLFSQLMRNQWTMSCRGGN
uniref:TNFR-Cys domain-containing protein n=1 Tax=Haplochromis burtoni TaxID=8153 RepID=A0A3Q2VG67_HAPBU